MEKKTEQGVASKKQKLTAKRKRLLKKRASVDRTNMRAIYDSKSLTYKFLKRFFDIVLSATALIVLSPLLLITAVLIIKEDGFPVIYSGLRCGKDMKSFPMHKFRSMYKDADARLAELLKDNEQTGRAFKIKDDPRITKIGNFIRKFSIDELPQLVNILTGEMSIVGPRAILDWQMEEASDYEKQRQIVQPGLTCYWQVGGRSSIEWEEWVELDLDYIQDMSLLTDIKLILLTIPAIFRSEGAY